MIFTKPQTSLDPLRVAIVNAYRMDENQCIKERLQQAELASATNLNIAKRAHDLVSEVRKERTAKSGLDAFLYQYDLSSEEGVALMCLAEALLRIPDDATIDQLIRDKITPADWKSHVGKSDSMFVNAATWGLMLTGKILNRDPQEQKNLSNVMQRLLERTGQPVIRNAVRQAMKILGQQFVMGRNINEALKRAVANEEKGYRYSYDMLGEAARTKEDAQRYFASYQKAITAIKEKAKDKNVYNAPGISVKLSALHPRYEFTQKQQVFAEIVPLVKELALQAKAANIGFTIDAEEADRLDFSLDIIEAVFGDPDLKDWQGFGLAVQAYQKRAYPLITWLINLGHKYKKRINVRLVKGAYWDYEIKDSQMKGFESYPVFTRKVATDVSYIACAKQMIAAPEAIYCQFATHNAHTVATILELMGNHRDFEFQALHGMGHALYDQIIGKEGVNCRIYAPVGSHEDLLAYLVRRLLENGANTSFVNRIIDAATPLKDLTADPIAKLQSLAEKPHHKIPLPENIFAPARKNSKGLDLSNLLVQQKFDDALNAKQTGGWTERDVRAAQQQAVHNPADHSQILGYVTEATKEQAIAALERAEKIQHTWQHTAVEKRAALLEKAADLFEQHYAELIWLLVREAGKNLFDAIGEVREAIDACRYYAAQARQELTPKTLTGYTGEYDQLELLGRGVSVCISPWNFPLAIFTAQITAALAAGNPVLAKPAEPTMLIAIKAVELLHAAGIPQDVLQLVPGKGSVIGAALIADPRVKNIIFTGSTETARNINQTLANRAEGIPALIAETGGQNCMIVDSTALPEQVVVDAVTSAFNSAGQRCSALRVLYLQEEVADKIIHMLKGAMMELRLGDPGLLQTDIGPVINEDARNALQKHQAYLNSQGAKLIYQVELNSACQNGTFFAPCAYEIPNLKMLKREVFGPMLHVIRYAQKDLDKVINDINSTGYGLTFGIHSRINEKIEYIRQRICAGNIYVNRNIIGAVIGVQPFGGENLSGTGPKAGGPHYLARLCIERTLTLNTTAAGGNASLMMLGE